MVRQVQRKLGTPVRVNVLSGIVSTVFMVAAVNLSLGLNSGNTFKVVLYLATSTTLLSYLLIFTGGAQAALQLSARRTPVPRPRRDGRHVDRWSR